MIIKIGNQTRAYMEILQINSYPFTEDELRTSYRILIKKHHTDKGGSKEKAQEINNAYNELKNLAISEKQCVKMENFVPERDTFYSDCPYCNGTGKKVVKNNPTYRSFTFKVYDCFYCHGTGKKAYKPFNPVIVKDATLV